MGNRAVITTPKKDLALYLHWNGGLDTVEPLLKYCELQGYRPPSYDSYGWARMAQVMGNFFGGSLSVGIDRFDRLGDQGDNGVYVIDGWKIVGRIEEELDGDYNVTGWHEFPESREQHEHDFDDMLRSFDKAMPPKLRLGSFLDSVEVPVSDIRVGDLVFMRDFESAWKVYPVVGFGEGVRNGSDVTGVPYVARYDHDGDYSWNCNNYVQGDTAYIMPRK
ncbi:MULTISPECIES: hypothetical protein [unclassified Adlercreutzia]|uniref:hypothetical protein n=1 Tax=unclassified Adlercreutzia TaxID=2636013 RepID=UPI0013EA581A|nr:MULTISPECIES: hypothetical protein [unclassified Adlercreutzia]